MTDEDIYDYKEINNQDDEDDIIDNFDLQF